MTQDGVYKKISVLLDQWLELHKGETFDLDLLCRQLDIKERSNRNYLTQKLSYEVRRGTLEKSNRIYRYINNNINYIDWINATETEVIDLRWPYSHDENNYSHFSFDENVIISPGDIIVIAGVSNMGKTALCLNFLWDNMDFFPCTIMGNEYKAQKFKRRIRKMTWAEPLKEDGTSKFELIDRRDNWKDIIRPDNINIIDWINLPGDKSYDIGIVLDGIQSKLNNGIAIVSIQKGEGRDQGIGGQFSEHISSIYLNIDFERLTVKKAKEWKGKNPNGKMYGFTIVDSGTQFHNIREIKRCHVCRASGFSKGNSCDNCAGTGYVDV